MQANPLWDILLSNKFDPEAHQPRELWAPGWPKPSQHLSTQLAILGVQTLDTHLFNLNPKPSPNLSCCMLLQNLHACKFVETAFRLCSSRLTLPSLKHDLSIALAQSSRWSFANKKAMRQPFEQTGNKHLWKWMCNKHLWKWICI